MGYKVFVDGQEGTTGLKIHEYLSNIASIEVIKIDESMRKDNETRKEIINEVDLAFLCLPDSASKEIMSLVSSTNTKIIDASTAFRTNPEWTYGLPELHKNQRELISSSSRVSVPGCHATGFILPIQPLIAEGIVPSDYPVTCFALTGYSGGGKKLISEYENSTREQLLAPRPYALSFNHKHLPEMQHFTGLRTPPIFNPIVGNYYQGDAVTIPLHSRLFNKKVTAKDLQEILATYYADEPLIRVMPYESDAFLEDGFFNLMECNGTNHLDIFAFGGKDEVVLMSRFDNLGKGASGAAIQNMCIMLGLYEGVVDIGRKDSK